MTFLTHFPRVKTGLSDGIRKMHGLHWVTLILLGVALSMQASRQKDHAGATSNSPKQSR